MLRKTIKIDDEKCNGCGACATACHEGAIEMINGKAVLTREDYCDGLGDCLPACPADAISFENREAKAYDKQAVEKAKAEKDFAACACSCPGIKPESFQRDFSNIPTVPCSGSNLAQWPCQIKLVPVNAAYFDNANLLIAADCSAFAYGNFHRDFMKNHITLIGCPKLDDVDYSFKLTQILLNNNIKSLKVVRMEVSCCGGLEAAVKKALKASGKLIPWHVVTLTTDGKISE